MQIKYKAFLKKKLEKCVEKFEKNGWKNFRKMFGKILEKCLDQFQKNVCTNFRKIRKKKKKFEKNLKL